MTTTTSDPATFLTDLLNSIQEYTLDTLHDFQDYIGQPKVRHWLRIIVIVAGYIMLRPAIELFFKWWFERKTSKEEEEQKKKKEEEDKQLEAEGLKKPKKDGNSLRVGAKSEAEEEGKKKKDEVAKGKGQDTKASGKKAATANEATNKKDSKAKTDEYENSDQEDFAEKIRASGVLEWGRDARKRKQRQQTEVEQQQQQQKKMDEEKLLELLDWSDDEGKQ